MVRVGVIGLGLIGGSIALGFSRAGGRRVWGYDSNLDVLREAVALGAVQQSVASIEELAELDQVFVAVPPDEVWATLVRLEAVRHPHLLVSDCTSVKAAIVHRVEQEGWNWFVGGHPMAGSEVSGLGAASADLFKRAKWVFTPGPSTSPSTLETFEDSVSVLGADSVVLDAKLHDEHVALLSHLPHAIASVLLHEAYGLERPDIAGPSWRDMTRVGISDPNLWLKILTLNREPVLRAMGSFLVTIESMSYALEAGDEERLRMMLSKPKEMHEA